MPAVSKKKARKTKVRMRTVTGTQRKGITNEDRRRREYLTKQEIERLRKAAANVGRHRARDSLIILMMYLHGLRISELVDLRWSHVRLDDRQIHVRRKKGGTDSIQDLRGDELRALRRLKKEYPAGSHVFVTERDTPITGSAVQKMIRRAGQLSGLQKKVGIIHPHMLRHSTGYALANRGIKTRIIQGYLGHKNISHIVRYTKLSTEQFRHILPE